MVVNTRNMGPGRAIRKRKSMKSHSEKEYEEYDDRPFFGGSSGACPSEERFDLVLSDGALSGSSPTLERRPFLCHGADLCSLAPVLGKRCLSSDILLRRGTCAAAAAFQHNACVALGKSVCHRATGKKTPGGAVRRKESKS